MPARRKVGARGACLILASLVASVQPVAARIIKSKPAPSENWSAGLPIVVGGGFEFETDREQSLYDFPLLFEYSFSEQLKVTIEPNFSLIESKSKDVRSVGGVGDLETTVQWEFLRERRYRPALTLEGLVKWPIATDPDLGTPKNDYGLGLTFSKDLAVADVDLNVLYTFVGSHEEQNVLEIALAGEYPIVNHLLSVIGEVVHTVGTGASMRTTNQTEGTLGVAWQINKFLKLEFGYLLKDDLSGQVVTAWEWSFEGED